MYFKNLFFVSLMTLLLSACATAPSKDDRPAYCHSNIATAAVVYDLTEVAVEQTIRDEADTRAVLQSLARQTIVSPDYARALKEFKALPRDELYHQLGKNINKMTPGEKSTRAFRRLWSVINQCRKL